MPDPTPPLIDDAAVIKLITTKVEAAVANKGDGVTVIHFGAAMPSDKGLVVAISNVLIESEDRVHIDGQPDRAMGTLTVECVADMNLMQESVYALAAVAKKAYLAIEGKTWTDAAGHELIMKRTTRRYMNPPPNTPRMLRVCAIESTFRLSRASGR